MVVGQLMSFWSWRHIFLFLRVVSLALKLLPTTEFASCCCRRRHLPFVETGHANICCIIFRGARRSVDNGVKKKTHQRFWLSLCPQMIVLFSWSLRLPHKKHTSITLQSDTRVRRRFGGRIYHWQASFYHIAPESVDAAFACCTHCSCLVVPGSVNTKKVMTALTPVSTLGKR